jgi:hypothetical protein
MYTNPIWDVYLRFLIISPSSAILVQCRATTATACSLQPIDRTYGATVEMAGTYGLIRVLGFCLRGLVEAAVGVLLWPTLMWFRREKPLVMFVDTEKNRSAPHCRLLFHTALCAQPLTAINARVQDPDECDEGRAVLVHACPMGTLGLLTDCLRSVKPVCQASLLKARTRPGRRSGLAPGLEGGARFAR